MAMIAAAGLLSLVTSRQGTRDPQDAGHDQGGDLGGHSPDGLQIHAPSVSGTSTASTGVDGGAGGGAALGAELVGGEGSVPAKRS
jgi:hypothetical protein